MHAWYIRESAHARRVKAALELTFDEFAEARAEPFAFAEDSTFGDQVCAPDATKSQIPEPLALAATGCMPNHRSMHVRRAAKGRHRETETHSSTDSRTRPCPRRSS